MKSVRSRVRADRTVKLAALLGSASFATIAGVSAALAADAAPPAAATPVEEILITGSLIRGTQVPGVPVTAVGAEDFTESGALTVTEMLRNVPALDVDETTTASGGGGTIGYGQSVSIHSFSPGSGVETLMLINGKRWPVQGHGGDTVDPSIIPRIAVQRIDVLAAGASAVYGSDATSGVVNVILKRGFDGAITEGQVGGSTDIGGVWWQFSQLYGRSWDTGNVTISYEYYNRAHIDASKRHYYTTNFEPYGLSDQTPLSNNVPAVITAGNPTDVAGAGALGFSRNLGTRWCANCMSIPAGAGWDFGTQDPGPTTSWATLLANPGVKNQRIPYLDSYLLPDQHRNAAVLTFDQELFSDVFGTTADVALFVDAFYSNRRAMQHYHATGSGNAQQFLSPNNGWTIPTNNPYRPSGTPAGTVVRAHYTFGAEMPNTITGGEVAARWSAGFNVEQLPFDWRGDAYYSMTDDHNYAYGRNMINSNMLIAALGNTVPSQAAVGTIPGQAAFTKPANIPYLNILCDSSVFECNAPQTLKYISAFRDQDERWKITQFGVNLTGPIYDLPGGTIQGALSYEKQSHNFHFFDIENRNPHNTAIIANNREFREIKAQSIFGQLDIPLVGGEFSFPGVQDLLLSLGYRYDLYEGPGSVYTPKVALDWLVGYGLTVRGAWGKAFRVPSFQEDSGLSGTRILGVNAPAGGAFNTAFQTNCVNPAGFPQGVALPGSLTAILNPSCAVGLREPGGLQVTGGSSAAKAIRAGQVLGPQKVRQWSLGVNIAPPEGILAGLNIDVTWFHIRGDEVIGTNNAGEGPNDPRSITRYIVAPNPALPADDPSNASFWAILQELRAHGSFVADPTLLPNIKFIEDGANQNIGWVELSGIDFDGRYDWEMGNIGSFNVGLSGYYELRDRQQSLPGAPISDTYKGSQNADGTYSGANSGSHFKRARARLGWTDTNGIWSAALFTRYYGHGAVNTNTVPPACFWAEGFGPGSCYPGSPYNAQPGDTYGNRSPSMYFFDLSVAYNTMDQFTTFSPYMSNITLALAVNNVLNKEPPFQFADRGRGRDWVAADTRTFGELQRVVSFTITKNW
jgi:iron complex outermembrane receptor protein